MENYGFQERLSADFPSQICVDIAEVCNLACRHCPHPAFKLSPHYAARYLAPTLNHKLVTEVAQAQGVCQYIRYTSNGEPLIHPQAYDMLQDAVDHAGVFVTLTTNGTIMNEKRTRRLLASGLHMVDISLDAHLPETYARIRKGGDLDTTRANVLRLLEWRDKGQHSTRVVVSFIEQPDNSAEIEAFRNFWQSAGADAVVIRQLHTAAGAVGQPVASMRTSINKRRPCLYPWERLTLNARGQLAFCPVDWFHQSEIPDFAQHSIREVWQGSQMQALREAHLQNAFAQHPFCGNCPDWALTRWPGEGRVYADLVADLSRSNG